MKISILTISLSLLATLAKSQVGIDSIIVEKYYLANSADSTNAANAGAIVPLKNGKSVTYRVYVAMAAGYKFSLLKGNANHPLIIKTSTNFYNDPNNGVVLGAQATSTTNVRKNTVLIDSWLTTGGVAAGKIGVIENEDTDGSLGNAQSILANNPGGKYGNPINGTNAKDGMINGTTVSPTTLGFGGPGSASDVFDQSTGGTFSVTNGAMSALPSMLGYGPNNIILLGQFTTDGDFSFELNIQLIKPGGAIADEYVAKNPIVGETLYSGLTYSIAAITTNTNVGVGVEEISNKVSNNVNIVPNPAKDSFSISVIKNSEGAQNFYSIYDSKGILIANQSLGKISSDYSQSIDISNYTSGLYLILISIDGNLVTKKLIKE
ncbi:MAG: T9SS type A sorting domain-containing protein [Bacteroidota bacterium]